MKSNYIDGIIYSNLEISPNIFELSLEGEFSGKPGQFYMLRGWEAYDPLLARPISIADFGEGRIKFLYEVRGRGTHLIGQKKKGDKLSLLGPLGNGFDSKAQGRIGLISGGIGIAPMLYLAKHLAGPVDIYSGFRSNPYFLEQMGSYVDQVFIATEDGSEGHKGFVTELFDPKEYDFLFACGPIPMMEAVIKKSKGIVPVYLSMEARMACGIGACLGCTVRTSRGMERVCKEGPVFKGEEVVFND